MKPEVEVTEIGWVSPAQATIDLTSTGYVVPQRVAKVGAKVTGRITKVNIVEGQEVKTGDLLFELDPTDQRSAVASAQARALAAQARATPDDRAEPVSPGDHPPWPCCLHAGALPASRPC